MNNSATTVFTFESRRHLSQRLFFLFFFNDLLLSACYGALLALEGASVIIVWNTAG